jgi:purine-binding chemotaxis protein CheW
MVTTVEPRREASPRTQGVGRLYLTCTLAGARYLIPTNAVREVEEVGAITPVPATPSWLRGVMNLRGTIIAVVDLAHFLGLIGEPGGWTEALVCTAGSADRDADDDFLLALSVEAVSTIRTLTPADILPLPEQGTGEATRYLTGFYRAPSRDGAATELLGVLDLDALLGALVLDQQGALG